MSLIGDIFQGISGANAAKAAANSQVIGAQNAQKEIGAGQKQAHDFQQDVWTGDQTRQQPYVDLGAHSANSLANYLKTPFSAPTLQQAENMPGFQFQLQQGSNAIDQNAAANGTLMSGNTGVALQKYGQGLAETGYNNLYNQAMNTYQTNLGALMGGAGIGQNANAQLGSQGQGAANNMTGIDLGGAEAQAQQINNAAAARASGYIGKANAYNGAVTNMGNHLMEAALMAGG